MTIPNMPPQKVNDPRGLLCFAGPLPQPYQDQEDATQAADFQRSQANWGYPFRRPATPTEHELLNSLGYGPTPGDLVTWVSNPSGGVRMRRWPQLQRVSVSRLAGAGELTVVVSAS